MGKIAFVFSGQGDQFPGMGKDLYDGYDAARKIYEICDKIRPDTSKQCFLGSDDELKETKNTQPCLFATELAAAAVLTEKGIIPDAAAGFSLGEVAAAAFCGLFDLETGFRLVCRRGELMQSAAEGLNSFMAAVVKLSSDAVAAICEKYPDIYAVNFNCPGQVTVSGLCDRMTEFFEEVKAAGGRAIPLKVKGAFHSPFMNDAAKTFGDELKSVSFHTPAAQLYSNATGDVYSENYAELLSKQICSPVQWEKTVRTLISRGTDTFIEIGPGRTLTNMIKKTDASVDAKTVFDVLSEVV